MGTISVKLNDEITIRLKRIAEQKRRTPQWVIVEAINRYIEQEEKSTSLYSDVLESWNDYQETGEHVAWGEAKEWLQTWGKDDEQEMRKTKLRPISVDEMLKVEFLEPLDITPKVLAEKMGVEINTIGNLLNGGVLTAPIAIKLAAVLGNTTEFWLNIQNAVDLWDAQILNDSDSHDGRSIKHENSPLNIEGVDLGLSAPEIVSIVKGSSRN